MHKRETRRYSDITKPKIDLMVEELTRDGAKIAGRNPWHIETIHHGIVLTAEWDEAASVLAVTVMHYNWYVPREKLWSSLDKMISHVQCLEIA
jgi:hypothetical protein